MHTWRLGLVLFAACAASGKAHVTGSNAGTTTATTSTDAADTTRSANGSTSGAGAQSPVLPPYPTAPADPWRGVVGDQPRTWSEERASHWVIRSNEFDCSAAHDHCVDPDAWFVVRDGDLERKLPTAIAWEVFGPDRTPANAGNAHHPSIGSDRDWTAFRTVPATKSNIAPGTPVVVLDRSAGKLTSGVRSHDASWWYGIVDKVDSEGGSLTLQNRADPFPLWGARVVVLSWKPGGKVEIVGNRPRNALGVKASETYLPE